MLLGGHRKRLQADLGSPLVNLARIFDGPRTHPSTIIPIELCAVNLRVPFVGANTIKHHCHLPCRGLACGDGDFQQGKALALERWQADRMLSDQPCSLRSFIASNPARRPSYCGDDRLQLPSVRLMHGLHLGMVAVEQATIVRKSFPNFKIMRR